MALPPLKFEEKKLAPLDFGNQAGLPPLKFEDKPVSAGGIAKQFGAGFVGGHTLGLAELGEKALLESTMGKDAAAVELKKRGPQNKPEEIARIGGNIASFFGPSLPAKIVTTGIKGIQAVGNIAKATKLGQKVIQAAPQALKTGMTGKVAKAAAEGAAGMVALDALTLDRDEIFNEQPMTAVDIGKEMGGSAAIGLTAGVAPVLAKVLPKSIPFLRPKTAPVTGEATADKIAGMVEKNIARKEDIKVKSMTEHISQWADRFEPIRVMEEMAQKAAGVTVPVFQKGYESFRKLAGSVSKANLIVEQNIAPLYKQIGQDRKLVDQVMLLESAREKAQQGVFLKGITEQEANTALDHIKTTLGQQKFDQIVGYSQQVRDLYTRSLKMLVQSGIKSQAEFDRIFAKNQAYAPWHVVREELEAAGRLAASGERGTYFLKKKSGTEMDVESPLDELLNYVYEATINADKNVALRKLVGAQSILPNSQRVVQFTPGATSGNTIHVFENGVKRTYTIKDNDIYSAIKGLNAEQADVMTRFASVFSKALREGATTFSAPFAITNPIRDVWNAALTSPIGFTPKDFAYGLWTAVARRMGVPNAKQLFSEFINSGAGMSGQFETYGTRTGEELISSLSSKTRILSPFNWIREIGVIGEESTRLGLFKRAIEKGINPEEAAFLARNGTIDFNKVGTSMKTLNLWIPFLNARTQGTLNVVNAAKNKDTAARFWTTAGATIGLPAMATMYNNLVNYPDVWKSIRPFDKRDNFLFIYGRNRDENGKYTDVIKIPKADVGRIFGGVVERMMEFAYDKDQRTFYGIGKALGMEALEAASAVSPVSFAYEGKFNLAKGAATGLTPAIIRPLVETATNTNLYTGKQIIPEKYKTFAAKDQWDVATSKLAVGIGQVLPISPFVVDNALQSMFGGAGRTVGSPEKALDMIGARFKGAYSGGEYAPMFDALQEAKETVGEPKSDEFRQVQQAFIDFKKIPESDRAARYNFLSTQFTGNKDMQKKLFEMVEEEMSGTPGILKALKASTGNVRIQWYLDYSERAQLDDTEKTQLWMWLQYQKLITPEIMKNYYGGQQ